MKFKKNALLKVRIEETNMLGFGVAKIDGVVVFIQNGVEGDLCEIKIIKCAKNYSIARIEHLIEPSDKRCSPLCDHFRRCGGCSFQHVSYEYEKELKLKSVQGFLLKEGLADLDVLPVVSTDVLEGYRNKAQFPVAMDEAGKVFFGFYAPKTHKVCPLEECSIQNPIFTSIAKSVCEYLTEHRIPAYCETDGSGLVRHIYLRIAQKTGQVMLCLVLKANAFPDEKAFAAEISSQFSEISSICINIQPENTNVILGKQTICIYGSEKITDEFCERNLLISPLSFYQVNHDAAEILYKTAFNMANLDQYDHIIDLYCGIGSISLSAHSKCPITGVEIIPEAVEDAKNNALLNGVHHANYICGDATDAFEFIHELGAEKPLLIVDPPRKGLTKELIIEISKHNIGSVLYISCGPDTFARDLAIFRRLGYEISSVQPVDLFPRTSHIENIAVLHRKSVCHFMNLDSEPFRMMKNGQKTIELRLNDDKRKNLQIGDKIVFENRCSGETLCVEVKALHLFSSFEELYQNLSLLKCGYSDENVLSASHEDMKQYYSTEDEEKFGVVGIEFVLI